MCVNKFYSFKNEIIFQYEPTEGRAIDKLKLAHNYSGVFVLYRKSKCQSLTSLGWGRGVRLHAINLSAPSKKPQNTSKHRKPLMNNAVSTGKNCAKIRISNVHVPKIAVSQGVYGKMYNHHLL